MSENLELLQSVQKHLQELSIVCEPPTSNNPRSIAMQHMDPVTSLRIPNQFYVLADRINCLEKMIGASVSKRLEMANSIIEAGGTAVKISSTATGVETRLERESNRFLKKYRNPRKGGTYRKGLLEGHTKMLLFKGETESIEANENASIPQEHFKGKSFEQLGDRQQRRRRSQIRDALGSTCSQLNIGLSLTSVQLETVDSHQTVDIQIQPLQGSSTNTIDDDHIPDIVYLMLKHGVSLTFYHELCQRFKDLPRAHKVQQFKKDMPMPTISKTPGKNEGAQFDFDELFIKRLEEEIEEHPAYYLTERHIRVRVSGDGARYNRNSNFCLMSFSIIRNGSVDLSSTNIHTIAAIKTAENYADLAEGFKDIFTAINAHINNPIITINSVQYTLEFFLCADYKFLLLVMGLKNATAKHSCIWCTIDKENRHDMTITSHTPRTHAHLKGDGKLGSINIPLLDLELNHVIPDELHLMLRVMDVLIQGLIDTVLAYDRHQHRLSRSRRSFKPLDGPMLNNLVMSIRKCGIYFCLYEQADGSMEWPSLLGPDKIKLLKQLPNEFGNCQPAEMAEDVQQLWKDFDGIYTTLSSRAPSPSHDLHQRAKDWVKIFLQLGSSTSGRENRYGDGYYPNKVTPYMHILVYHMPTFLDEYENIIQFSCQGVEQNNDVAKGLFFRSSNKWDATTDILANKHRLHELKDHERIKRKYTKRDDSYWKSGGILKSRKKRPRISHYNNDTDTEDSN